MAELMSHGQHEFIRIVLGFFEVDRHLEKRACVVERIYECQRGAAGFIAGLEPAKETKVSELAWGRDRCEGLPRADEGGARLAETQRAKVAVDDNMGNGKNTVSSVPSPSSEQSMSNRSNERSTWPPDS